MSALRCKIDNAELNYPQTFRHISIDYMKNYQRVSTLSMLRRRDQFRSNTCQL